MKIQNKIALIFTILSATIILALSVFIYIFASGSISESFFHRLEVRSDIVGHAAVEKNKSRTSIYYDIKEKHLGDLPFEKHRVFRKADSLKFEKLGRQLQLPDQFFNEIVLGKPARAFKSDTSYVGLQLSKGGEDFVVISSAVDLFGLAEMDNLKNLLIIGFLISMLVVFSFGKLFSAQVFNPIRRIIRNVKGINAHNLHQRLVTDGSHDEVADLSRTFNDMLDRLEITFEIQNNFVSNASHEFRTPLTVISGEAQLGLSIRELPAAARDSFTTILRESEKLEHLTNSMLSLAQTGFDGKKEQWGVLRMDELILAVKEAADMIIPGNLINIDFDQLPEDDEKLNLNGNETLLKAALTNIVLNSCKYSDNKLVNIIITADQTQITVEVIDYGIGIPDKEIGQIFVPFFRASNTEKYKGYGIGLPLANNIIRMHQGNIIVRSKVGEGTHFIIQLPIRYQ